METSLNQYSSVMGHKMSGDAAFRRQFTTDDRSPAELIAPHYHGWTEYIVQMPTHRLAQCVVYFGLLSTAEESKEMFRFAG